MSASEIPERPETTGRGPGYETRDVHARPILWAGVALLVLAVFVHLAMWWTFDVLVGRERRLGASDRPLASELRRTSPPEPRLQASPRADLLALRAWEERQLTTYGWVDRDEGIVRMPVGRAMDLLVERGLPSRPAAPAEEAR